MKTAAYALGLALAAVGLSVAFGPLHAAQTSPLDSFCPDRSLQPRCQSAVELFLLAKPGDDAIIAAVNAIAASASSHRPMGRSCEDLQAGLGELGAAVKDSNSSQLIAALAVSLCRPTPPAPVLLESSSTGTRKYSNGSSGNSSGSSGNSSGSSGNSSGSSGNSSGSSGNSSGSSGNSSGSSGNTSSSGTSGSSGSSGNASSGASGQSSGSSGNTSSSGTSGTSGSSGNSSGSSGNTSSSSGGGGD